jgi:hypothetical protein
MVSQSAPPIQGPAPAARRWALSDSPGRGAADQRLAPAALEFAVRCHAGQRRESDGAPFIAHPLEVARLLRDAGCSEVVVAAGLLHDIVEDTDVALAELATRFGAAVSDLVQAVTDEACVESYRERKQALRERVRSAGVDAALLFAADKISKVRELPDQLKRDQARFDGTAGAQRARNHLEQYHQLRLEHYQASLEMVQSVAPRHALVEQLADELESCCNAVHRAAIDDHAARGSFGYMTDYFLGGSGVRSLTGHVISWPPPKRTTA